MTVSTQNQNKDKMSRQSLTTLSALEEKTHEIRKERKIQEADNANEIHCK